MQLARQPRPKRRPILLGVVAYVKALVAHVQGDFVVYLTGALIPKRPRITIIAHRAVNGLPRVELITGAHIAAQHRLELAHLTNRQINLAVYCASHRSVRRNPGSARGSKCVVVFVDVHELIAAEIDRIRIIYPCAAEEVRVFQLKSQRFPPARRCSFKHSGIWLTNCAELFFYIRNQLLSHGIAVWSIIGRVHTIAIREKRTRLDESDQQKARRLFRIPFLKKLVPGLQSRRSQTFLLLCAVRVVVEVKGGAADVALGVHHRITLARVVVEASWQDDSCAEIYRHAPELAQRVALDLNVLYPLSVFWRIDRRHNVIEREAYFVSRRGIETNLLHIAVEVAGRDVEKSPAHIPMHPKSSSVAALTLRINVEHRLHVIITRRQLRETFDRVPECCLVNDCCLTGLKILSVNSEDGCGVRGNLEARLGSIRSSDDKYYSTRDRSRSDRLVIRDFEPRIASLRRAKHNVKENDDSKANKFPHCCALARSLNLGGAGIFIRDQVARSGIARNVVRS